MFWRVMAIFWTVLLLILVGVTVKFVLTAQPDSSKVGVSSEIPRDTQATAILTGVPPERHVLIPALISLRNTDTTTGKSEFSRLSKDLQTKSFKDLQRHLVVHRFIGNMVAICVRGCKSDRQAQELARAVADSYIRFERESKAIKSKVTIEYLTVQRDFLRSKLKSIRFEKKEMYGSYRLLERKLQSAKLERLDLELDKTLSAKIEAECALEGHKKMKEDGLLSKDPSVRQAFEFDRILNHIRTRLIEVKAGLIEFPSDSVKKAVIAALERELKVRRKEVLKYQTEITSLQYQLSSDVAVQKMEDLAKRLEDATSKASKGEEKLCSLDIIKADEKELIEQISKIEQRLNEIHFKLDTREGLPELLGVIGK